MGDELPQAKKRVEPQKSCMDSLPEEVIGTILSHVASARNVARACATSHRWLRAAKDHLHTLTFDESDFAGEKGALMSSVCERIITRTVLKTRSLHGLSICVDASSGSISFEAAALTEWLLHTKKTLRWLKLMNSIKPSMNILEELGGGKSNLVHLEWGSANIPALDPSIHRFESLISLTLSSMETLFKKSDLQALFIVCPNLESLSLKNIHIWIDEGTPLEPSINLKSSSLKALNIDDGLNEINSVILHADCLESLCLKRVRFELLKLVQDKEKGSLRQVLIERATIEKLEIGQSADSLQELQINAAPYLQADWPRYYEAISGASNLRRLYLSCNVPKRDESIVDLSQICSSFPQLDLLSLTYQHAPQAFRSAQLRMFQNITVLELATHKFHTRFATWICEFVKRCPKLKRLMISGRACWGGNENHVQEMADYMSLLVQLMRPYPHVDIGIQYF